MKMIRILACAFIVFVIILFNWDYIYNEHNIYILLLCSSVVIYMVFLCIRDLLNWKETRPVFARVFEGTCFALFGILAPFAAWSIYTTKGYIAIPLCGAIMALASIILSISFFFNWQKNRPKLYSIINIASGVLILIMFLALFIYGAMSM